jgi:hypothetical protein
VSSKWSLPFMFSDELFMHLRSILILSSHLRLCLRSGLLPFRFSD